MGYTFGDIYYVDVTNGNNANAGTDMTNAWKTFQYAMDNMGGGNLCFFRQDDVHTFTSTDTYTLDGTFGQPTVIATWPRGEVSGKGDFTNGSISVSNSSISMSGVVHNYRELIGPDGRSYTIGKVDSTSTFKITPKYSGVTATSADFTISKDKLYDYAQSLGSGDGVTEDWDSDASGVMHLDMGGSAYLYWNQARFMHMQNIRFTHDGTAAYMFRIAYPMLHQYEGCSFESPDDNKVLIYMTYGGMAFKRCGFQGYTSYDSSSLIFDHYGGTIDAEDCVFHEVGIRVCYPKGNNGTQRFYRCHFGFDGALYSRGFFIPYCYNFPEESFNFIDCTFEAGSSTEIEDSNFVSTVSLINTDVAGTFQKGQRYVSDVYDVYRFQEGDTPVGGGTVNLRDGGATELISIGLGGAASSPPARREYDGYSSRLSAPTVLRHLFLLPSGTHEIKYYVQNRETALNSGLLWMELKTCSNTIWESGDRTITKSVEPIAQRSDENDWTQYMSASGVLTASGLIEARIFTAIEGTTYHVYVDPKPEITTT